MGTYVLAEIMGANESTMLKAVEGAELKYGLTITAEDVHQLVLAKKDILVDEERIELDEAALPDLLERCAASSYVNQENLVEIVAKMQEAFYRLRNEWGNLLSDDSLKTIMMIGFEKVCGGDVEAMETTFMAGLKDYLAHNPALWHIGAGYVIKTKKRPSELGGWYEIGPEPDLNSYVFLDLSELDDETCIELSEALFGDIVSVSDEEIRDTFYATVLDDEIPLGEEELTELIHSTYPIHQLLPILKKVARKFKGTDCSSIKNHEAKRLLAGIDYSIQRGMQEEGLLDVDNTPAELIYNLGQKAIFASYKHSIDTLKKLQKEILHFDNKAMVDDVKAAGNFLYHYDYKFMPHLGHLALSYPVLTSYENMTGLEMVEAFLNCILCEQTYFRALSRPYLAFLMAKNVELLKEPDVNCMEVIFKADFEKVHENILYFDGNTYRLTAHGGNIADAEFIKEKLLAFVHGYVGDEDPMLSAYLHLVVEDFVLEWTKE